MTVAGGGDIAEPEKEIHLHLFRAGKAVVHPVGIHGSVAGQIPVPVFAAEIPVMREKIMVLPHGAGEPGKMVDSHGIYLDLVTVHILCAKDLLHHAG